MRVAALAIPFLLAAAPAPDETPITCPEVGAFAAWVAAQRVAFVPEEKAGRINGASQAGQDTLRSIVRLVYRTELSPTSAQFFAWRMCEDTAAEAKR